MHIAQIIDGILPGGAEKLQITFAQEAHDHGQKLTVISLSNGTGSPYPRQLMALGASVNTFPSRRLLNLRRMWHVTRFLRRVRPDVLHTHLTYANIIGTLAGRLAGVPVVTTLHTIGTEPRHRHPMRERLEIWALRYGARRVIAVGHAVAEAYRPRLGRQVVRVIPNAVPIAPPLPPEERAALRAQLMADPTGLLLISVGRLSPPKAFQDLLTAFAAVLRADPSAFLAIAGGGTLYDDLAAQITALGLAGHAALLGTRDDVPQLLAASDVFVCSSHWEGLPLAVLEAMAAGLPVVATNVGDVAWALNGTGIVVPPREPAALAEGIRSLLNDPERRRALGAAARARVVSHFSTSAWFDRILAVYQEVCPTLDLMPQAAT